MSAAVALRRLAPLAVVASAVLAVLLVLSGGSAQQGHRVSVIVREATNVAPGQYVREAGSPVGEVVSLDPVDDGARARLVLEIEDAAWPLPADSELLLRWGGTANFSNRYIALTRGRSRRSWQDDAVLPARSFDVPVEFDGLLRTFDARMRTDLKGMLDVAGPAFLTAKPHLRRALREAPPALRQARHVLADVDAEREALDTLIRTSDRVLGAVDAAQPGVRDVLTGAAGTFDAIADEERSVRAAIDRAPVAFAQVRTTLKRANPTLLAARDLTRRLAPGVRQVRGIARPLNGVLGTLEDVGPDARATLTSLGSAAPALNPLLDRVRELSPQLESIGKQADEQLDCIRPYMPDIMGFASIWGDFFASPDGNDKMWRAQVQSFLPMLGNTMPYTPADAKRLFPGLEYGFPRPPGTNAGQPWFLPECGAGPDALDPEKDPEARIRNFTDPPALATLASEAGRRR